MIIYQDKLYNTANKNIKVKINNQEFLKKLNLDLEKLQNKLEQYKDIFNFKKNQNNIYPNDEELNKIFDEFNTK